MKILELRFKNLNSIYGEWVIDFTAQEYISDGIFALTGPTGAGKSTILDAICLALYGATPRLGKITKSGNEIMSRQVGECYAEVLFASQAGRFRCHWEQRRARKKVDGKLQDQEHQIADAITGKPIETKKSLVSRVIEEKTGMDFDRFTRSMLLAQGGFDTFLKAEVEQKSKILEQITGTEIYSKISLRVHECQREERERLNLLQAEISGIVILEPKQEKEMQQELEVKQKEETDLAALSAETERAITWLISIDELKKEISKLSEEKVKLQDDIEAFKPEHDKLEQAQKAASLDGSYAILTAIRKQQSDDQTALKAEEGSLPGLVIAVKEHAEKLKSAEQQTINYKEEQQAAAPLMQKIRALDQKLCERKKTIAEHEKDCKKDREKIDSDQQVRLNEQKKRTNAGKNLERVNGYLTAHAQDEWLISGLAGIEEQLGNLLARQKEIRQTEVDCKKADSALKKEKKKLDKSIKLCTTSKQKVEETLKNLKQEEKALQGMLGDRTPREYRTEKENLLREMAFLTKIRQLEDQRVKLEDGKPCPLCGSNEHPYARGNIPELDETEKKIEALTVLISKVENQEIMIKKLEKAELAARKNLLDNEKSEANAAYTKKVIEEKHARLKESLGKNHTDFNQLKQMVSSKLLALGLMDIPDDDISSLLESLRKRLKDWQRQVKKKTEIEKHIADLESEIKRLDGIIDTQSNILIEKQERLEILIKDYTAGKVERKELYGDKIPDHEEQRLNRAVANAEKAEKKTRDQLIEMQEKMHTVKIYIESLQKRIVQRDQELRKSEAEFTTEIEQCGFIDEKQYVIARLPVKQREALSAKEKDLDNRQMILKEKQKDRETQLRTEIAKKVTDKPLEEMELQSKAYEKSLKQLRDILAGLRHRMSENRAAKERLKEKMKVIEAQKKECHRWEKLHGLIGSVDGKKYRNFAQGLTFELMVSHANRQLEKMTDRYLLIRDNEQPLELNVIDNYQAGEIRSTKNLSGGESFIVSLALALGLSKMASRKVRVDSLFLDEGFGTLDEDALETALETLSGLQQDGKLIGIISHVSALKERISTQITATPISGGRSTLAGPGCRKVINKN